MKKLITILSILLWCSFQISAQPGTTITIEATVCYPNPTLNYIGTDGGTPERYIYEGILVGAGNDVIRVDWNSDQERWEINYTDTDMGGVVYLDYYLENSTSAPKPPTLGTEGTWVNNSGGLCGDLTKFEGTGTQDPSMLPVELVFFEAKTDSRKIRLLWQTASEINNERFEIEESWDGGAFQKIGEMKGNGTTSEQQDYSFVVDNPRNGVVYYRLKQIDFDGQFEYSKVISVDFKGDNDNGNVGAFYPNPSQSGMVNLRYNSNTDEEIIISVFDVTGKFIINQFQQVSNGDNNLNLDFSELNSGIYIVKIGVERNLAHRKLIIKK